MSFEELEELIRKYLSTGVAVVVILVAPGTAATQAGTLPAQPSITTIEPDGASAPAPSPDGGTAGPSKDGSSTDERTGAGGRDPERDTASENTASEETDPGDTDVGDSQADVGPEADNGSSDTGRSAGDGDRDNRGPSGDAAAGDGSKGDTTRSGTGTDDESPNDRGADSRSDNDSTTDAGSGDISESDAASGTGDSSGTRNDTGSGSGSGSDSGDRSDTSDDTRSGSGSGSGSSSGSDSGGSDSDSRSGAPTGTGDGDGSSAGSDSSADSRSGSSSDGARGDAGTDAGSSSGTTAAEQHGWGEPNREDDFSNGTGQWDIYDGPGHAGEGTRSPSAVSVQDGLLTITGDSSGTTAGMAWNPGQKYGRWEGRVRAPEADPSYNALLLLWPDAEDFPVGGEIDFMEMMDPTRRQTDIFIHYGEDNSQVNGTVEVDGTEWHNWAVEWTPDAITAYVDGEEWYRTTDTSIFPPGPMHLCIQLDWFPEGDTPEESIMQVDWVRQYPLDGYGKSSDSSGDRAEGTSTDSSTDDKSDSDDSGTDDGGDSDTGDDGTGNDRQEESTGPIRELLRRMFSWR